jgi:hypothetical protein
VSPGASGPPSGAPSPIRCLGPPTAVERTGESRRYRGGAIGPTGPSPGAPGSASFTDAGPSGAVTTGISRGRILSPHMILCRVILIDLAAREGFSGVFAGLA